MFNQLMARHKGLVIGSAVAAFFLFSFAFAASVYGFGADRPIAEEQRGAASSRGGVFFMYLGTPGASARGVRGRGAMGGGFRGGKN